MIGLHFLNHIKPGDSFEVLKTQWFHHNTDATVHQVTNGRCKPPAYIVINIKVTC